MVESTIDTRSPQSLHGIGPLPRHRLYHAADALGRAFYMDPFWRYIQPDDDLRLRLMRWYDSGIRYGLRCGAVHASSTADGVAVWISSDRYPPRMLEVLRSGMPNLLWLLGPRAFMHLAETVAFTDELHKRDAPLSHWYLFILGVRPELQGRGIGSALLQPMLTRADVEGKACYLETSEPRNIPFYQRHGFKVITEATLPRGGTCTWTMRRDPR